MSDISTASTKIINIKNTYIYTFRLHNRLHNTAKKIFISVKKGNKSYSPDAVQ